MADPYYRLRARVKERSIEEVEYAVEQMKQRLDILVPVKSGNLKNSQEIHISENENRVSVSIRYPVPYARSSDLGWQGGVIRPKNHPVLYFFFDNAFDIPGTRFHGPDYYRFDEVNHPGWEGKQWYSIVVNQEVWAEYLRRAADTINS